MGLLTRVPVPVQPRPGGDLARAVGWFPVVGLGIGAVVGLAVAGGGMLFPPLVAAALAVGIGLLLTGAFHEDGLADTFDALGSCRDRPAALQIMKDSRIGTFGAAALLVALVCKIAALAALPGPAALLAAMSAATIGRGAAGAVTGFAPPARPNGLGVDYLRAVPRWRGVVAAAVALVAAAALLGWQVLPAAVSAAGTAAIVTAWALRRLGGVTGDVLGAVAQLAELAVLVTLSAG